MILSLSVLSHLERKKKGGVVLKPFEFLYNIVLTVLHGNLNFLFHTTTCFSYVKKHKS